MPEFRDEHHLLHTRKSWELYPEGKSLRDTKSLRPVIPREVHNEIHRNCPAVPILGYYMLLGARKHFEPTQDTLETVDSLCFAIERASWAEKMHPIDRDMGDLTIEALRLQVPFLREAEHRTIFIASHPAPLAAVAPY